MSFKARAKTRTGALAVAGVCIGVAALYLAQEFLKPLALSVLLCFILAPASQWFERRLRFHRVLSVVTVSLLAGTLILGVGWIVAAQVTDLAKQLPSYQGNIERKVGSAQRISNNLFTKAMNATRELRSHLDRDNPTTQSAASSATQPAASQPAPKAEVEVLGREAKIPIPDPDKSSKTAAASQPVVSKVEVTNFPPPATQQQSSWETIVAFFGPVISILGNAAVVAVFVIFMLIDREDLRDRMIALVSHRRVGLTTEALDDAASRVSRYLLMLCCVNGSYGLLVAVVLWLIGVPAAALWGLLCAVLRFVPYIGPWIAASFPVVLSLAVGETWAMPIRTVSAFLIIELVSNNVMEPMLYGKGTGVSPVAVIVSAAFWTWLWGTSGLLMATPLTVCVAVIGRHVEPLRFLNILLGDEPALPRGVRYYQRLLARDEVEAMQILRKALPEFGLATTYDTVAIVALKLAERDARREWLAPDKFREVLGQIRDQIHKLAGEARTANTVRQAQGKDPIGGPAACDIAAEVKPQPLPTQPLPPPEQGERRRLWKRIVARRRRLQSASSSLWSLNVMQRAIPVAPTFQLPKDIHPKILILPARDEPDEIAGLMLSHVLTASGYAVTVPSIAMLAQEMVNEVTRIRPALVVVSATPPSAVAHARYLAKRLTGAGVVRTVANPSIALPETLTVLWSRLEKARLARRLSPNDPVNLATTLCSAVEHIRQLTANALTSTPAGSTTPTLTTGTPATAPATV